MEEIEYKSIMDAYRTRAEAAMKDWLPKADTHPSRLHEAMCHSLNAGGKRLRPMLVFATAELNKACIPPDAAAAAVEALHTYSLIHDDLPCMDDSELRRGKPTCHVAFDEATALLAGDALLTEAFALLARAYQGYPTVGVGLLLDLGDAAGSKKLIGGQMEDLLGEREGMNEDRLNYIHRSKTAALLTACVRMGARLACFTDEAFEHANELGHSLGMAFQIIDDILDATADAQTLGKTPGLDEKNGTLTFLSMHGIEKSREIAKSYTAQAVDAACKLPGDTRFLCQLIYAMEHRIH